MGPDELHDPYCGGCEMAQEDYKELEKVVDELSVLVRRLAHRLKKIDNNNKLHIQAVDYLTRNNLIGAPLRHVELQGENKSCHQVYRVCKHKNYRQIQNNLVQTADISGK